MKSRGSEVDGAHAPRTSNGPHKPYFPEPRESFAQLGIPESLIESLVFKHLLAVGTNTGRGIAVELALPGKPTVALLTELKNRQLVVYKGNAVMGDFEYMLTESGRERARGYLEECTYCGPAPVSFSDYVDSVAAQTIANECPGLDELRSAFSDLLLSDDLFARLGPAVNSGRGLFLYGTPGNGKTSIAERITACFGTDIWAPRAIFVEGEIIQYYDPQCHETTGAATSSILKSQQHDERWVKVRRPTIVVGGELTLDSLELRHNPVTKITEPSIQLKSNCGTLVIDDFGRQRVNPIQLLNRWIVPLEKRFDYLTLTNGKKIQAPFDQLIIFSTNLEPKELVDDAFLRRIPYKIHVPDPTEEQFRELMRVMSVRLNVPHDAAAVNHLVQAHYRAASRAFKSCHPRDLLLQLINQARYSRTEPRMNVEGFDLACANYFTLS
jgi:predicted ATPase with chaperone activity